MPESCILLFSTNEVKGFQEFQPDLCSSATRYVHVCCFLRESSSECLDRWMDKSKLQNWSCCICWLDWTLSIPLIGISHSSLYFSLKETETYSYDGKQEMVPAGHQSLPGTCTSDPWWTVWCRSRALNYFTPKIAPTTFVDIKDHTKKRSPC